MQEQKAGERAGADDDDIIGEFDRRNFKQLQFGLNDAKVERRQEIETPDEKAPEAELECQRIGKVICRVVGVGFEVDQREHDQSHVEAGREQDGNKGEKRSG